jgi:membrane associated rhomboid family serine protease
MFRTRGENLRSVFILLFLNAAFFLLEHQDAARYARLFRFEWKSVMHGEVWRLVTWQFTQAGQGWLEALSLFVTLLLLYMMGSALEEEWGTRHFVTLFLLSTLVSAAVAAWLGIALLGTYFVYYTLLLVYAIAFPRQTLFLFGVIPVGFRLIALVSFGALIYGVFAGGKANIAALAGALMGLTYYASQRIGAKPPVAGQPVPVSQRVDTIAIHNAARFAGIRKSVREGSVADMERLLAQCDRDAVPNVNVCPAADYKPDQADGYCIRCEGFAECSARFLRSRLAATAPATSVSAPAAPASTAPAAEPAPLG